MSEKNLNLTRRKFMAMSSAAIAAPFVMKMTGTVPHVEAAAKEVDNKYAGMKSIVIYYSMTGNTKKIAQGIQKGIIQRTGQCDIIRLKDAKTKKLDLANYDLIGIGTPVYSSDVSPQFVDYVTKRLPSNVKGKHAFLFVTHGTKPGRCIIGGVEPLQKAGLTVIGWKDWFGGCTYLYGHSMPWITDGHPDAIDIAEAEAFGTAMAEHSWKVSDGWTDRIPKLPSPEAIDAIYGKFESGIKQEQAGDVSNFLLKVNAEKCIGCGLCAQACYFEVIDASVKPSVFKRPEDCVGPTMAGSNFCSGICPTGAIEVGMSGIPTGELGGQGGQSSFPTGSIAGAPKNPNRDDDRMKAGDFLEATGRFRRLVPEEDLNWNITWEEAVGDPPRYKEIP